MIYKQALDQKQGWPIGRPIAFANPKQDGFNPDGSVVDDHGILWNAQYGGSRVVGYQPDGKISQVIEVPAINPTCPAFMGANLGSMVVTTAAQGLSDQELRANPENGQTLVINGVAKGQPEHPVIL